MQRAQNFTGIPVIRTQDTAMTESMGAIVDRSQEHLGTTDVAVIAARRRLINMARDLAEGIEPVGALKPDIYNVRAVDMVRPEDDFFRFMDLYAAEAVGKSRISSLQRTPNRTGGSPVLLGVRTGIAGFASSCLPNFPNPSAFTPDPRKSVRHTKRCMRHVHVIISVASFRAVSGVAAALSNLANSDG